LSKKKDRNQLLFLFRLLTITSFFPDILSHRRLDFWKEQLFILKYQLRFKNFN